jgi:Fungal calcium binding protein
MNLRNTRQSSIVSILVAGLAISMAGCVSTPVDAPPPVGQQVGTVQSSQQTFEETGVSKWAVNYDKVANIIQVNGLSTDGDVISQGEIRVSDQYVTVAATFPERGEMVLTRDGQFVSNSLSQTSQNLFGHANADLRDAPVAYGFWSCLGCGAGLVGEAAACFAAGFELGLNPIADLGCVADTTATAIACNECFE